MSNTTTAIDRLVTASDNYRDRTDRERQLCWDKALALLAIYDEELADMAERARRVGAWLTGGDCHAEALETARDWREHGFSSDAAKAWWDAGVFTARAAAALRDLDVTPAQAATVNDDIYESGSLGYAVANCDMSAARVAELVRS